MPRPCIGPRPGGWETLLYPDLHHRFTCYSQLLKSGESNAWVKIENGGSLNDNHGPTNIQWVTHPNSYRCLYRYSWNAVPDPICPQSRPLPLVHRPQIKLSTLFVAMTTVRIQSVGSAYASRLPARRGETNQWHRGRRSRKTVCVEDKTACRCKKSRKQAANVLRLLIVRVTANSTCHIAKGLYFETSRRMEKYWPAQRLWSYPRHALLGSAQLNTKISPVGWGAGSWTNSRC